MTKNGKDKPRVEDQTQNCSSQDTATTQESKPRKRYVQLALFAVNALSTDSKNDTASGADSPTPNEGRSDEQEEPN